MITEEKQQHNTSQAGLTSSPYYAPKACEPESLQQMLKSKALNLHKQAVNLTDLADKLEYNALGKDKTLRDILTEYVYSNRIY